MDDGASTSLLRHDDFQPSSSSKTFKTDSIHVQIHAPTRVKSVVKLNYHDILPQSTTESFSSLVKRANEWLKRSGEYSLYSCETLQKENIYEDALLENSTLQIHNVSEDGRNYHWRCLRLWLKPQKSDTVEQFARKDCLPKTGETLKGVVRRLNKEIEEKRWKGRIIAVETVSYENNFGVCDSDRTFWSYPNDVDVPVLLIIRVFYSKVREDIHGYKIGLENVSPQQDENGQYESFSRLVDKANIWLNEKKSNIINLQSSMVVQTNDAQFSSDTLCHFTLPAVSKAVGMELLRILRVWYLVSSSGQKFSYAITHENFIPEIVFDNDGTERFEKMKELISKINRYLNSPDCSRMKVLSVETFTNPGQTITIDENKDIVQWVETPRLYLQPIGMPSSATANKSSNVTKQDEHPGPIFLSNVVSGKFRYKMVVAFLCIFCGMLIIVVLSVVYSNK